MMGLLDGALTAAIADLLLRATVLLLIAHTVLFALRRRSAASRELAGRWFLIALCLLPLLAVSGLSIGVLPAWSASESVPFVAPDAVPVLEARVVAELDLEAVAAVTPSERSWTWSHVTEWALFAWIAGACVLIVLLAIGHVLALRRLFGRSATELPPDLRARLGIDDPRLAWISPGANQPVVAGLLRARIALPPAFLGWPRARQRAILAHERAHVDRRDGIGLLVWLLARALWWPHPLVWTLGRQLALLREQACDDRVIEAGVAATAYASVLVDVARDFHSATRNRSPVLAMTTTSQLEARVRALLHPDVQRARPRGPVRVASAALALSVGLVCATGQAIAQGENSPPPARGAEQPVEKPAAELPPRPDFDLPPPPDLQDPNSILLTLTKDGKVVHAGREIGVEGVTPLVKRRCDKGDFPVIIQSAPDVSASLLVRVIDHAKNGGAEQVAITTVAGAAARPTTVTTPADVAASLRVISGDATADAVPIASLDTQPKVVYRPAAKVTAELRARLPATVWVLFVVNEQGDVAAAEVQKSTDERFHQAALDAVAKWRFEPGKRDGEPVSFHVRVPIVFPADSPAAELVAFARKFGSALFNADRADHKPTIVAPKPILRVVPKLTPELRANMPAIVWLAFVVDQEGKVSSQQVLKSTDAGFERAALDAIGQWRFEPGTRDGEPVVMETRIPIPFVDEYLRDLLPSLEGEMERLDLKELERRLEGK